LLLIFQSNKETNKYKSNHIDFNWDVLFLKRLINWDVLILKVHLFIHLMLRNVWFYFLAHFLSISIYDTCKSTFEFKGGFGLCIYFKLKDRGLFWRVYTREVPGPTELASKDMDRLGYGIGTSGGNKWVWLLNLHLVLHDSGLMA
jgi:hypothetical protein